MISENRTSLTWTAPAVAVDPVNHFHWPQRDSDQPRFRRAAGRNRGDVQSVRPHDRQTLYLRLAAISDALVRHSALEGIRRDFLDLWEVWPEEEHRGIGRRRSAFCAAPPLANGQ